MAIESQGSAIDHNPWLGQPYQGARMPVGDWMVANRNALPRTTPNPPLNPFVFAHGANFNWDIWHKTGALDHLRDAGHRTLGIDLPALGNFVNTRTTGPAMTNPSEFWQTMLDSFGIDKAIGVFPSQSGPDLAFPILRKRPDTLNGIVLVAPIKVSRFTVRPPIPALVVWSRSDPIAPWTNAATMARQFPNATVALMDGDSHVPYISRPNEFNYLLEWFGSDPASASQRIGEVSLTGVSLRGVVPSSERA